MQKTATPPHVLCDFYIFFTPCTPPDLGRLRTLIFCSHSSFHFGPRQRGPHCHCPSVMLSIFDMITGIGSKNENTLLTSSNLHLIVDAALISHGLFPLFSIFSYHQNIRSCAAYTSLVPAEHLPDIASSPVTSSKQRLWLFLQFTVRRSPAGICFSARFSHVSCRTRRVFDPLCQREWLCCRRRRLE